MPFPSVLNTFNRPTPTDRLNSPSHSALHNTVSSAVGQIEAVIGLNSGVNASAIGTLMYDVRSPNSNGGGHVQTANKGGTGQTVFLKGDLLVGTSTSVLSKLAVSSTSGEVLVIDPNQATGMKWGPVISNKVAINLSSVILNSSSNLTVLYSTSILGSTLGVNNGIKFRGILPNYNHNGGDRLTLKMNYGNNEVGSVLVGFLTGTSSVISAAGVLDGMIVANGANAQLGSLTLDVSTPAANATTTTGLQQRAAGTMQGSSSVNSSATQNLVITGQFNTNDSRNSIMTGIFMVEKIG